MWRMVGWHPIGMLQMIRCTGDVARGDPRHNGLSVCRVVVPLRSTAQRGHRLLVRPSYATARGVAIQMTPARLEAGRKRNRNKRRHHVVRTLDDDPMHEVTMPPERGRRSWRYEAVTSLMRNVSRPARDRPRRAQFWSKQDQFEPNIGRTWSRPA